MRYVNESFSQIVIIINSVKKKIIIYIHIYEFSLATRDFYRGKLLRSLFTFFIQTFFIWNIRDVIQ